MVEALEVSLPTAAALHVVHSCFIRLSGDPCQLYCSTCWISIQLLSPRGPFVAPPLPAFIKPACLHRLPSAIELSWSETTHPINRASPPLVVPPQTLRSFIDKARLSVRPRTGEPLHTRALAIINHSP